MLSQLLIASQIADFNTDRKRKSFLGALAVRRDGVLVYSRNGSTLNPIGVNPSMHAEARVLRKAGYGSTIFVSRIRKDSSLGMAKPCTYCMAALKARGVETVYWTINNDDWDACVP